MQNPFEGLLGVYRGMVEVLLVLVMFLTKDFEAKNPACGAPSCSKAFLFFGDDLLCLRLESVQYYLQHEFALIADEADRSVVLALL